MTSLISRPYDDSDDETRCRVYHGAAVMQTGLLLYAAAAAVAVVVGYILCILYLVGARRGPAQHSLALPTTYSAQSKAARNLNLTS
jgi:hypothetical protein